MSGKNVQEILTQLNKICESYSKMNDESMQQTAKRLNKLKLILEKFSKNMDINELIQFARETYNNIDWENKKDNKEISCANRDYRIILVHLLNIFIANNRDANLTDFERTKEEFGRIVNIIEGFRKN